jgi:hypothetical protein
LEGLRKTAKHLRTAGIPAVIWTESLPNTSRELYL